MANELIPVPRKDVFELLVKTDKEGVSTLNIDFPGIDIEALRATRADEERLSTDFVLKKQASRLLDNWTSTSIGFFEAIPRFSDDFFVSANLALTDQVTSFAHAICVEKSERNIEGIKERKYIIEDEWLSALASKLGSSSQMMKSAHTMRRSTLGALISEYEVFLSDLLRIAAKIHPAIFVADDESIKLSEVEKFKSYQELKQSIVEKKVESFLHEKSHLEQIKWIEEKFGVNLTSNKSIISDFVEVCQRRHLVIHTGAIVSEKYIENCKAAGIPAANLPEIGDELHVSNRYLRRATARIYLVGYFTGHILMQKLIPSFVSASYEGLIENSHDFLSTGLTKMTRHLCEFGLAGKTKRARVNDASLTINLALSYYLDDLKEDEKQKAVSKALERYDWSDTSRLYLLAIACLNEDYCQLRSLTLAAKEDGLTKIEALTWTLFVKVRDRPDFIDCFN